MNLSELFEEWDHVSYDRKMEALKGVVQWLTDNPDPVLLQEMLSFPSALEDDDYFGTEGFKF